MEFTDFIDCLASMSNPRY
ncbi:hypothetical protein LINPERPRIM_LOCUS43932 [Linum perenne]